jgi:hypothetical protein
MCTGSYASRASRPLKRGLLSSMSLGYAEKLSYRDDVGSVGQKEIVDDPDVCSAKCDQLADMVRPSAVCYRRFMTAQQAP